MNSVVKLEHKDVDAIPFQEASLDIWDKKYRLSAKDGTPVDKTMDDTYKRVARALADVEQESVREHWNERFLWALRRGAIPAGRVTSNAGALEHKPATSTINCTVSGTVGDSMDDILNKVHEAGLTLKAGCGIGYEFSTLRPRGAYVSGAGAYTSGPLSFMDIYDKMCFTVSSAGGRRGAQMGTFDIGHPDALEFIRAKRENGRLRQFNLSLLITDEFMKAVREDKDWNLAFPLSQKEYDPAENTSSTTPRSTCGASGRQSKGYVTRDDGLVCCKIYKTLPARRMWDVIMSSTYDFAEPGFILIDRVNEMNNNWWCENIRATNPCVPADTWVQTSDGPRQVAELIGKQFTARVDGLDHPSSAEGFFRTAVKPLMSLVTTEGFSLRLTADHRVRRISTLTRWRLATEWCAAGRSQAGRQGAAAGSSAWDILGRQGGFEGLGFQRGLPHGPAGRRRLDHRGRRGAVRVGASRRRQQRHRHGRSELRHGRRARCRASLQPPLRILRLARSRPPRRIPSRRRRHHRAGGRARPAPGPPDHHAGHRAWLERVLPRLPARAVRFGGQRAGHAGQGRVDPARPLGYLDARRRAAHAAAARHRRDHLPQPRAAGPGHHRRERGALRRAHRLRRHRQARAPGRAAGQATSAR